jgi:hypothetical protein
MPYALCSMPVGFRLLNSLDDALMVDQGWTYLLPKYVVDGRLKKDQEGLSMGSRRPRHNNGCRGPIFCVPSPDVS